MEASFELGGVRVPRLVYGTAWKEERTASLVAEALAAGFRGIDTANQRKHYLEAGVGEALASAGVPREALYLQTKFTYARGQDHRLPYDPSAPLARQVEQSFERSLSHLGTTYLDGYVLHGPELGEGWTAGDREVWGAMEALLVARKTRLLGVSNVSARQLALLLGHAEHPPSIAQNRCHARTGWDREVRAICREHGIAYQGFSLLTANRAELASTTVTDLAARLHATVPQLVFSFAMELGMMPLTGTTSRVHMVEDLAAHAIHLDPADAQRLERIAG
jgi:diketogulonate reductase-like aldo/keto reductase